MVVREVQVISLTLNCPLDVQYDTEFCMKVVWPNTFFKILLENYYIAKNNEFSSLFKNEK
jgi:hypothetical protein